MTDPGQRPHFITVERATTTQGELGGLEYTWHAIATGWAAIRWGSGQERREGAQENANLPATFELDWTPALAAVRPTDRLNFMEKSWDVSSAVVIGINRDVHLTAVANLDAEVDS